MITASGKSNTCWLGATLCEVSPISCGDPAAIMRHQRGNDNDDRSVSRLPDLSTWPTYGLPPGAISSTMTPGAAHNPVPSATAAARIIRRSGLATLEFTLVEEAYRCAAGL